MRTSLSIFIILLAALIANAGDKEGIAFLPEETTFQQVLDKAKAENKIVFIDAYTTWCGPCKWLDKNVFTDTEVGDYFNANFISAKFDMEKGEGLELAKKYNVKAYPTLLFVDGNGELVHRICGAAPKEKFLELSKVALDEEKRLGTQLASFESGNREIPFLKTLLVNVSSACMNADNISKEYWELLSKDQWFSTDNRDLFMNFVRDYKSDQFQYLLKNHTEELETSEEVSGYAGEVLYASLATSVYHGNMDAYEADKAEISKLDLRVAKKSLAQSELFKHSKEEAWDAYGKEAISFFENFGVEDVNYANSLSWDIYENVDDKVVLVSAAKWMEKALKISGDNYAFVDTHAALLLKSGDKEAGTEAAKRAIEIAKSTGEDYSSTTELLEKYK